MNSRTDTPNTAPLLSVRDLSKAFAGRTVVSGLNFDIYPGEVVALIGENGAGKSTTKNMLCGLLQPTTGQFLIDGKPTERVGAQQGISAVHQELSLFQTLTVAENICISHLPGAAYRVDLAGLRQIAQTQLDLLGIPINPDDKVEALGAGQQQIVEIAKALLSADRLLILDEPTTSLTAPEREKLFAIVGLLRARGTAIVFISHFMDEVFRICDRYVVLRDGQQVAMGRIDEVSREALEGLMVGRQIEAADVSVDTNRGDEALRVVDLCSADFEGVNFTLHKGEVLGFSGLMGAGRTEVAEAIFGLRPATGAVYVNGVLVAKPGVRAMMAAGMAYVPEDRRHNGLFLMRPLRENISAAAIGRFVARWLPGIGFRGERGAAMRVADGMNVSAPHIESSIGNLSGGNQQKALLGRWLATEPSICILDEPTKGVDIGARADIHARIAELAASGVAVIIISSDLTELLQTAHRIVVMRAGHLVGEFARAEFDAVRIISLAAASAYKQAEAAA